MNQVLLFGGIARRILRNKLKTFFMTLGITLGVFVLTSGLTLGSGFRFAVLDYFDKTFLPDSITLATNYGVPDPAGIDEADVAALLADIPELRAWSPLIPGGRINVERNAVTHRAGLTAAGPGAPAVVGQSAVLGAYISDDDVRSRARVILLGNTVKEALFGAEDPLGQPLTLGSQVYTIKGVLSRLGADPHGGDLDNVVVIPYTTQLQINKREDLGSVRFRTAPGEAENVAARMTALMRARHNIGEGRQDDFFVATAPAGRAAFDQFFALFRVLLPAVTGLILLIALLVIASLMLIAVKERTAEIGLRKALGARPRDIERQFLLEVVGVALLGGLTGLALSYPGLLYVEGLFARYGSEASFLPQPPVIAASLLSALLTGVLAALWPAKRAARLSPVEALR